MSTDGGVTWHKSFETGESFEDQAFALQGIAVTAASLTTDLASTIAGFGLDQGIANSCKVKLDPVLSALSGGNLSVACNALQDLINHTNAQAVKKLTSAQAAALLDAEARIRRLAGC